MPLQFRRGTNAQRLTITPSAGEPIWTTDTSLLYIGDGTSVGGVQVVGTLPSTGTFVSLTVTNLHFSGDPVGVNQTTAWTGTVVNSQITSVSTSKVTGLSVVGWSNNYNDLSNKPSIPGAFNLSTVTNQALFTTSSVTFAQLTVTNASIPSSGAGIFVNGTGGTSYPLPPNGTNALWAVTNDSNLTRVLIDNFSASPSSYFTGRGGRGTASSPTAVQSGDYLASFRGVGYGATKFNTTASAYMTMVADENFTDTANGAKIQFWANPLGVAGTANIMATFRPSGINIYSTGTVTGTVGSALTIAGPGGQGTWQGSQSTGTLVWGVAKPNQEARITMDTYADPAAGGYALDKSYFTGRRARGSSASPTAAQTGDALVRFSGYAYGTTGFLGTASAGITYYALENATDSAAGGQIAFDVQTVGGATTATQVIVATMDVANGLKVNTKLTFSDSTVQTTAWTGSVSTSSVTGLSTIGYTGKLSDGIGTLSTSKVNGLSTIGYTGQLSDGIGTLSTSKINGLSVVGYTNQYADLTGGPNQTLNTSSNVTFANITTYGNITANTGDISANRLTVLGQTTLQGGLTVSTGTTVQKVVSAGGYPLDNNGLALIAQSNTQSTAMVVSNYASGIRSQLNVRSYGQNLPNGGAATAGQGVVVIEGSRGTGASPTATGSGDSFGVINFSGYDGTNWLSSQNTGGVSALSPASIFVQSAEAFANNGTTTTNAGTNIFMRLQPVATQLNSTSRRIFLASSWTAGSTATLTPPQLNLGIGQAADGTTPTLTPAGAVGSFGTGSGAMAISMTAIKPFIVGVPGTDTGPENAGITATNQLIFATGRNSATSGRRNALVTDDVVFSIIGQAQTSTNSTSNGQQVALINVAMQENATNTTRGTRMTLQTVNTGTTTISNRMLLSDRTNAYYADTHAFNEKTGSFSALSLTTSSAVFGSGVVISGYKKCYGDFLNTGTTSFTANTGTAISLSPGSVQSNCSIQSGSQLLISQSGTYNLQFSAQIENSDNAEHNAWFWIRKNGADIAQSATKYTVIKRGANVAALTFNITSNGSDYYQIMCAVDDTTLTLPSYAANSQGFPSPAIPAVIVNLIPVGA